MKTSDSEIEQIIDNFDFEPFQDEDRRRARIKKEINQYCNRKIKQAEAELRHDIAAQAPPTFDMDKIPLPTFEERLDWYNQHIKPYEKFINSIWTDWAIENHASLLPKDNELREE